MSDLATIGEAEYLAALLDLLPRGHAWPREPDSVQVRFWSALAARLAAHHRDALRLLDVEADPAAAVELLPDWERVAGLPDPCATVDQTTDGRRARVVRQLASRGGQSRAYFLALAAAAGYHDAEIREYRPATCVEHCQSILYDASARFVWLLDVPLLGDVRFATCQSDCDTWLAEFGDALLECVVRRRSPAHSQVLIAYSDREIRPLLLESGAPLLAEEGALPIVAEQINRVSEI